MEPAKPRTPTSPFLANRTVVLVFIESKRVAVETVVGRPIHKAYVKGEHLDPGYLITGRGGSFVVWGIYIERDYSSHTRWEERAPLVTVRC